MNMISTATPQALRRTDGTAPLIVHVTRQFAPSRGGLEDVIGNLCRQLLKRGFRVRVVTCNSVFAEPGPLLPAHEIVDGIEVVRIPWSGSTRYPIAPQVFRHLADADLIHVHAIDFFFDALSWGRLLHRRPMVATTHGGFFHTQKYAALKKIWFRTVTRASALGYRRLVCCSQSDAALFSQIAAERTVTIENGANTEKFAGRASPAPARHIVTIGRFSVNKRLDRLIAMMRPLVQTNPEWHLDIIGAPSDLSAADLERQIAATGLSQHVSIHAGVTDATIAERIGKASFFASASEYEGFGVVAIEAMSAGLVPLLHPNDAYRNLAGRHDCIRLVDFSEADGAARAFEEAYRHALDGTGASGKRIVAEAAAYSWDSVADRYVDVYETVLAKPRR